MSRITITQANIPSLPALHRQFKHAVETHFTYFPQTERRQVIRDHSLPKLLLAVLDRRRVVLVARSGRRLIGYAIGAAPDTGPAQMFWLYVDPDYRGANIGLSLLSRMLKLLESRGATEVSIATHDHRRYYQRQGFKFLAKTTVNGVELDVLTFRLKT